MGSWAADLVDFNLNSLHLRYRLRAISIKRQSGPEGLGGAERKTAIISIKGAHKGAPESGRNVNLNKQAVT